MEGKQQIEQQIFNMRSCRSNGISDYVTRLADPADKQAETLPLSIYSSEYRSTVGNIHQWTWVSVWVLYLLVSICLDWGAPDLVFPISAIPLEFYPYSRFPSCKLSSSSKHVLSTYGPKSDLPINFDPNIGKSRKSTSGSSTLNPVTSESGLTCYHALHLVLLRLRQ